MARHAYRARLITVSGERLSIPYGEAVALIEGGDARRVSRLKDPVLVILMGSERKLARDLMNTMAGITLSEVRANAGEYGGRRRNRQREKLGNFVDRAMTKIEIWPYVGDTRAVRVGPRPC